MKMIFGDSQAEALAALHLIQSMLRRLKDKGQLTDEEVGEILSEAAQPMKGSTLQRAKRARQLIEDVRDELL